MDTLKQVIWLENGMDLAEADSFKSLMPAEKEIVIAIFQQKISRLNLSEFVIKMDELIISTFAKTSFQIDHDIHNATIDELCSELQIDNGNLTFDEIKIAFKKGYKGEYGKFYGLSNATYFGWVNAYAWSERRFNATKAIQKAKELKLNKPELTEEEKIAIIQKGAINCFDYFKKTGIVQDAGNVTYTFLDKKGLIPFTKEVKISLMGKAKVLLAENEKLKLQKPSDLTKIKNTIFDLQKGLEEMKTQNKNALIAESKRLGLAIFFNQLIEMDENLIDQL